MENDSLLNIIKTLSATVYAAKKRSDILQSVFELTYPLIKTDNKLSEKMYEICNIIINSDSFFRFLQMEETAYDVKCDSENGNLILHFEFEDGSGSIQFLENTITDETIDMRYTAKQGKEQTYDKTSTTYYA